ncbi:sodium-dependent transporter [Lentisphaerota bacterium ZTH]|nr:sodium-dependent transporter [Lentisphaerota bacterium]WET07439.1 sodium-dependent transporter [Lentisphaerota bacterium ZTH]
MAQIREHWSGSLGFVLAAAGSAIGLGNIWKFPYIAGENGGGAFVLIYLICIAVIGLPVMLCEISLGRRTQKNPVGAFKMLSPHRSHLANFAGFSIVFTGVALIFFQEFGWAVILLILGGLIIKCGWTVAGMLGVASAFVILSYYSVIGGWTIGYIIKAVSGHLNYITESAGSKCFSGFMVDLRWVIPLHLGFMLLCALIILRGVRSGIEKWSKILMPILFVLLIVLILRGLTLPGAVKGVSFFLSPRLELITAESVLIALGHAFFTLSLAMGAMITYGSYISRKQNLFLSTISIVILDTVIAILAGLAIFPAVFAMGFKETSGPGLVFNVLPAVFSSIPGNLGWLWAALFFLLLSIAALTSGMSLLEVVVAFLVDELKWKRGKAVFISSSVITLLGLLTAVSFADWSRLEWLHIALVKAFHISHGSFFEVMDTLTASWMLPIGGLTISIFVGWIWGTRKAVEEIRHGSHNFADVHLISLLAGLKDDPSHNNSRYHVLTLASLWGIFIRFLTPVAVTVAFLHKIGCLNIK